MAITGFRTVHPCLFDDEELFDEEKYVQVKAVEEDNLYQIAELSLKDDRDNAANFSKLTDDPKDIETIMNMFREYQKKTNAEIKELKDKVSAKEKTELSEEERLRCKEIMDDMLLQKEREAWIQKHEPSYITSGIGGAAIGTILFGVGGALLSIAFGISQSPINQLKMCLGGACTGGQTGYTSAQGAAKRALEQYENECMKKNPEASKREAFEYAKKMSEIAHENSNAQLDSAE